METWTASDIALVISTAATGLSALAAFALPPITGMISARNERRKKYLDSAFEKIEACVASMDEVAIHLNNEGMRLAFLNDGKSAPEGDKLKETKYAELQASARRVGLLARYLGVDPRSFELAVAKLFSTRLQYVLSEGRLVVAGDQTLVNQHWTKMAGIFSEIQDEGAKLLVELQKKI